MGLCVNLAGIDRQRQDKLDRDVCLSESAHISQSVISGVLKLVKLMSVDGKHQISGGPGCTCCRFLKHTGAPLTSAF